MGHCVHAPAIHPRSAACKTATRPPCLQGSDVHPLVCAACTQMRPAWVPQLQMHCLAAAAPSALLLSRSATKGVRVFRVHR